MKWEIKFIIWADERWRNFLFDYSFPWLTYLGSHFAVILFLIFSWISTKKKKIFLSLLILYSIQSLFIYGLKYSIRRERPFYSIHLLSKIDITKAEIFDPSFPSAHATYSFMMATILGHWFPKYRPIFFIIAGFIGLTRIYLHLHFPTDIIVGAFLGFIITKILIEKKVICLK